ncbi:MAG: DNA methyltransferase [Patescibacteria group bacterium]|jgi:site-specific DNA-methyltransferase (adenine-specific)
MTLPVNEIVCGDCLNALKTFPAESINCCISSPPYWALRDYGVAGQLGLEPTIEEYIDRLCDIYDEVKRVLRKDGTCFVNLGDTYHNATKWTYQNGAQTISGGNPIDLATGRKQNQGIPEKCLCLIPQRFAIEMVNRGWILRNVIIWHKPNPMPSSANDRFTVDFEYVYFFVKNKKYFFEPQYEVQSENTHAKGSQLEPPYESAGVGHKDWHKNTPNQWLPLGRNKRTVWIIPTQPFTEWTQTCHLSHVVQDGPCDGRMHIVSPSCPVHGGFFDLFAMLSYGEHATDELTHILHTEFGLSQVRLNDFVPTLKPHVYYFGQHNWDYLLNKYFPSAKDYNNKNHKKAHALLTNPSCKPSAERLSRIVHTLTVRGLSEQSRDIFENNTWPDDLGGHLLEQMIFRTVDKPSFQKLLKNNSCSCGLYHIKHQETSHFATYPEKLIEPMILSGCPEFVCSKCGKPRKKIYKTEYITPKTRPSCSNIDRNRYTNSMDTMVGYRPNKILSKENTYTGFTDCGCGADFKPGIVFDPFMGSGTTAVVAAKNRRDWSGTEINPEYIKMANIRISAIETAVPVKERRNGQTGLFE